MVKTCPPGVFCLENITIFTIIILIIVFSIFLFSYQNKMNRVRDLINKVNEESGNKKNNVQVIRSPTTRISSGFNNPIMIPETNNVLGDLYTPPLQYQGQQKAAPTIPDNTVEINIPTQGEAEKPRQIGILTRQGGLKPTILPLMGNRLITNKDYYNYYTISDSNLNLKLPVSSNGKNCVSEYGCDMISDGDLVYVEGYNDQFKATVYENAQYRYIPIV